MNRFFFSPKFFVAAALATAALGVATVAEARPEVYLSVGFYGSPAWVEPAPVYVQQPRPVFVRPAPAYAVPPVFIAPSEEFERPRWRNYDDAARFEWERERFWHQAEWRRHEWREEFRAADGHHDRDGRMHRHDYRD